jgi:hypothetical protein
MGFEPMRPCGLPVFKLGNGSDSWSVGVRRNSFLAYLQAKSKTAQASVQERPLLYVGILMECRQIVGNFRHKSERC